MHRRLLAFIAALILAMVSVQAVAAASPPANDLRSQPKRLIVGAPIDYDGTNATTSPSDPTGCDGSHGSFPGPYFASVWFSVTATRNDVWFFLSAPTVQRHAHDYLAITFVYERTAHGLRLVDCTAFGNEATWRTRAGAEYLIMEAGLSSAVTHYPPWSDRGGHGSMYLFRSPTREQQYHFVDVSWYDGCGPTVDVRGERMGLFNLRKQELPRPPYLSDRYEYHLVSTNPDNGKWFREDGYGLYEDVHITHVKGTIFQFVSRETGRPYTLTTMRGTRIFADFGKIVTTFQVDTKGDDDVGNDEFIEGSFSVVRETGNHDAFHFDGDFCDIVRELLGDGTDAAGGSVPKSRIDLGPLRRVIPGRQPK